MNKVSFVVGIFSAIIFSLIGALELIPEFISFYEYLKAIQIACLFLAIIVVTGIFWGFSFIMMRMQTGQSTIALVSGVFYFFGGNFSVISSISALVVWFQAYVPNESIYYQ